MIEYKSDTLIPMIIGAAIAVHKQIGPGLLESVYEQCLCHELCINNIKFERQVPIPIIYKEVKLNCGFRADLVVEDRILIEVKSIDRLASIHQAQLISYMKMMGIPFGLLLNFNVELLKTGIRKFIL
jgi:GxxExxY protein